MCLCGRVMVNNISYQYPAATSSQPCCLLSLMEFSVCSMICKVLPNCTSLKRKSEKSVKKWRSISFLTMKRVWDVKCRHFDVLANFLESVKDNCVYKYLGYEDTVYRLHFYFYFYYKSVWAFFFKGKTQPWSIFQIHILNCFVLCIACFNKEEPEFYFLSTPWSEQSGYSLLNFSLQKVLGSWWNSTGVAAQVSSTMKIPLPYSFVLLTHNPPSKNLLCKINSNNKIPWRIHGVPSNDTSRTEWEKLLGMTTVCSCCTWHILFRARPRTCCPWNSTIQIIDFLFFLQLTFHS